MPIGAALALYLGMASKSPCLALQPKSRTPIYAGATAQILAGQTAFVPSGYSIRDDSLRAVTGFIGETGISRVLEFDPGAST